ncbi:MAG: C40 family peptidase, partial [Gaiellaceae bacterium]
AKLEAEQLDFNLKARRIEIQLRIQEREQMLTSAQSDLLLLLGQQQSARQADQAALMQQILSGTGNVGIKVVPGTPVETALAYHGIPYLWGGATPAGFDCSGLVSYVYAQLGVSLPHYTVSQWNATVPIPTTDLQPGDLVFFDGLSHVGIYIGADQFIHAPHTGTVVQIATLTGYWATHLDGAHRVP